MRGAGIDPTVGVSLLSGANMARVQRPPSGSVLPARVAAPHQGLSSRLQSANSKGMRVYSGCSPDALPEPAQQHVPGVLTQYVRATGANPAGLSGCPRTVPYKPQLLRGHIGKVGIQIGIAYRGGKDQLHLLQFLLALHQTVISTGASPGVPRAVPFRMWPISASSPSRLLRGGKLPSRSSTVGLGPRVARAWASSSHTGALTSVPWVDDLLVGYLQMPCNMLIGHPCSRHGLYECLGVIAVNDAVDALLTSSSSCSLPVPAQHRYSASVISVPAWHRTTRFPVRSVA